MYSDEGIDLRENIKMNLYEFKETNILCIFELI